VARRYLTGFDAHHLWELVLLGSTNARSVCLWLVKDSTVYNTVHCSSGTVQITKNIWLITTGILSKLNWSFSEPHESTF
jgi:hypothetical protein